MRVEEFDIEKKWWAERIESEVSWRVSASDIAKNNYNLDITNPNTPVYVHDDPEELLAHYKKSIKSISALQTQLKAKLEQALGDKNGN